MSQRKLSPAIAAIIFALLPVVSLAQAKNVKYPLTKFHNGCMAKGRVQDCPGTVMRKILDDGKSAIPVLISQLTETTRTKFEIADYWGGTRSGDVAYVVLTDLFTDVDSEAPQMPGVPDWSTVMKGCGSTAQSCWDDYLHKHGRLSVQRLWMRAWNLNKKKVYWDGRAQCFRVSKTEKPQTDPQ